MNSILRVLSVNVASSDNSRLLANQMCPVVTCVFQVEVSSFSPSLYANEAEPQRFIVQSNHNDSESLVIMTPSRSALALLISPRNLLFLPPFQFFWRSWPTDP